MTAPHTLRSEALWYLFSRIAVAAHCAVMVCIAFWSFMAAQVRGHYGASATE